jgi:hypothetical protein
MVGRQKWGEEEVVKWRNRKHDRRAQEMGQIVTVNFSTQNSNSNVFTLFLSFKFSSLTQPCADDVYSLLFISSPSYCSSLYSSFKLFYFSFFFARQDVITRTFYSRFVLLWFVFSLCSANCRWKMTLCKFSYYTGNKDWESFIFSTHFWR